MEITRYGQSAVLVSEPGCRVLIDPGALSGDEVFQLAGIDALFVSHHHPDHFAPDRLTDLRSASPGLRVYAPAEVIAALDDAERVSAVLLLPGSRHDLGTLTAEVLVTTHADIHSRMPRVQNAGLVLTGASGVRLFHPGDSYEATPEDIDVLAIPIAAPWASLKDTVAFADRVLPRRMFPVHDVHLSASGRAVYWSWIQAFTADTIESFDPEPGIRTPLD